MKLSENFSLSEFERSMMAERLGIDNAIPNEAQLNLRTLCVKVLQPLRELYEKPLAISSGYRCEALNKAVGGVPTSQHRLGEAADVQCEDGAVRLLHLLEESDIVFDQAILYRTFLHVSYREGRNRMQVIYKSRRS